MNFNSSQGFNPNKTLDTVMNAVNKLNLSDKDKKEIYNTVKSSDVSESQKILRQIITTPLISPKIDLDLHVNDIMRDSYKDPYRKLNFLSGESVGPKLQLPSLKDISENASVIIEKQKTQIQPSGFPEIVESVISTIETLADVSDFNEKGVPINRKKSYVYKDNMPQNDYNLFTNQYEDSSGTKDTGDVNIENIKKIKFSKKLKP